MREKYSGPFLPAVTLMVSFKVRIVSLSGRASKRLPARWGWRLKRLNRRWPKRARCCMQSACSGLIHMWMTRYAPLHTTYEMRIYEGEL